MTDYGIDLLVRIYRLGFLLGGYGRELYVPYTKHVDSIQFHEIYIMLSDELGDEFMDTGLDALLGGSRDGYYENAALTNTQIYQLIEFGWDF